MNLYELMSGNLQTAQSSTAFQFGIKNSRSTPESSDTSSFNAILGSKLSRAETKADVNPSSNTAAIRKASGHDSVKTESKPKFVTFSEAKANLRKTEAGNSQVKAENTIRETERAKDESGETGKKDAEADMQSNFLNICAELLGIDKTELQKLFDKAGISVESLKDPADLKQTAAELSQMLELNSEQAQSLNELFAAVAESVGMLASTPSGQTDIPVGTDISKENPAELSNMTVNQADTAQNTVGGAEKESDVKSADESFLSKLAGKIGTKLDEIDLQAEMKGSTVEDELKNLMQPLLEKADLAARNVSQQETPAQDNGVQQAGTDPSEQIQASDSGVKDSGKDSDKTDDGGNADADSKTAQKAVAGQPVQTVKETAAQAQFQIVQDNKPVIAAASEKAAEVAAKPRELISQIIEKAKVVLSPEKSEMVVDLKPDSLGKLSLKVVTENGIVMAKFIADNQQVRQILESNMQLLKDSLEKQGMNVQGFSVSVRQDQGGSGTNRPQYRPSGNLAARTVRNVSGLAGQTAGIFESNTGSNPYRWEDSTIDLTA